MKSATQIVGSVHRVADITQLSRQRWKQLCLYAIGLCVKCGHRLRTHTQHCTHCARRHGKYRLKQYWKEKLKDYPEVALPDHVTGKEGS